jgi:glycosyltransferase involved in cell wall biosynthesis
VDLARVVVVGRLSPEKGHVVLLNALKILTDNGNKVELEIIGAGPFERAIRKHQEHLGLDRVRYCGELTPDKISRRLADADVFCMPSFSEGLPVSIMEAMAVGVPVVTTWISGIPELAENGVTALTVPPGNSTALAAALERAIFDKVLTTRLVASARDRVEQMHSMRKNVGQLASLFEEHMMQRSTRGPAN